ncbi:MAG: M20/M25/M40 family metallo-hydrolase [Chloroflexia bacterium]
MTAPASARLYFHGHYDVVPATAEQFVPRRVSSRLYRRGASDMKGGLAAMIYAVRALADCGLPATGRIGLTLVRTKKPAASAARAAPRAGPPRPGRDRDDLPGRPMAR